MGVRAASRAYRRPRTAGKGQNLVGLRIWRAQPRKIAPNPLQGRGADKTGYGISPKKPRIAIDKAAPPRGRGALFGRRRSCTTSHSAAMGGKSTEPVTREYTINLAKAVHGITFKKRAPRAVSAVSANAAMIFDALPPTPSTPPRGPTARRERPHGAPAGSESSRAAPARARAVGVARSPAQGRGFRPAPSGVW